ncbi:hypothetical protein [Paraburkholderia fungorum]|nr:hypothetical protein [Paraburkholderia fungorum]
MEPIPLQGLLNSVTTRKTVPELYKGRFYLHEGELFVRDASEGQDPEWR